MAGEEVTISIRSETFTLLLVLPGVLAMKKRSAFYNFLIFKL